MTVRDLIDLVGPDGLDRDIDILLQGAKGIGCSHGIIDSHVIDHTTGRKAVCLYAKNDTIQISDTKETKKKFADMRKRNREYAKAAKSKKAIAE